MTKKFPMIFNKKIHATLAVMVITMFSFNTHAMVCKSTSDDQALRREKILELLSAFEKNIYTETLANGLKVVLYHYKNSPQVFIDMIYNVGSKDETSETYGFAHFIEHMIFKGTQKLSEQDIFHIADKFGAGRNAETSYDTTSYYFITDNKNYPIFLDILADCMHNATFDEEHIASELHTVFSELKNGNDDGLNMLTEFLPANHPYHHPIIGYKETLFTLNRDTLLQFYKTYYQPHNATLLITGNLDPKTTMPTIRSIFESLPVTQPPSKKPLHIPFHKDLFQKKITLYNAEIPQTCVQLFWQTPGYNHDNFFIADIIASILGAKFREKFSNEMIGTNTHQFAYEGCFMIPFCPQESQGFLFWKKQSEEIITETINKILKELETISLDGVFQGNLEAIKTENIWNALNILEKINNIHAMLKKSITNNFNLEHNELAWLNLLKKINTCTNEDIQAFTKKYLQKNAMHSLYAYPLQEESDKIAQQKKLAATDAYDQALLALRHRTAPIQKPIKALSLPSPEKLEILPFQKPQEITLSNGLTIFFIHQPDTLILNGNLYFKNQAAFSRFLKETNQTICFNGSHTLMTKKTALHTEEENRLFFGSYGADVTDTSFKCLAYDYEIIINRFLEIQTTPMYEQAALKKYKKEQTLEILSQEKKSNVFQAEQTIEKLFHASDPFYNTNDRIKKMLSSLTLNDIITAHKKFFNPANMNLIITGDFSKPDSKEKICTLFKQWKNQKEYFDITTLTNNHPPLDTPSPAIRKIPTEEEQILLKAIHKGPSNNMLKDNAALSFLSTLVNAKLLEIRESQGLFYNCSFDIERNHVGQEHLLTITTQVSKANYNTALQCIIDTLQDIINTPYPQDVFDSFCSSEINTLAINTQTPENAHFILKNLISKDYPLDYLHQKVENILRLTPEDITAVAKKYLDPSVWSFIIVGRINE
ncbi:MAG: Peptidase M16 domain protein [candidate division TM6 bacterium GW2011_GWF2_38_10]|nr:MAG: Peptidase M16 domain protein [candidate division TM6 bacterium GW2011_GWF2_38_10]